MEPAQPDRQTGEIVPEGIGRLADEPRGERAIVLDDIVKCYHTQAGTKRVLDGVSFRIGEGEKVAVLGRNGAGQVPRWSS